MVQKKTLILIDGHALAFRQYYALERTNMSTSSGTPTWAVYGFFKAIFDLLKNKRIKTDAIAVAFDVSHHTFRVERYSEYKSNRQAMPDPMRVQMELIMNGLKAFNIPIYTKEGFEADDVIGTISKRACELGHNVLILTGDQDAFQLVDKDGCVKVIIPSKGDLATYDWNRVHEKMGVYPDQVVDYKALRGDLSDNIPGIYGIGEKTAVNLLAEFGNLDNILNNYDKISKPALRTKIEEGVEQAKLSRFLATIVRDVDVDFDFNTSCVALPDVVEVTNFFREMQFYSFLKNMNALMTIFNNGTPCTKEDIIEHSSMNENQLQLNFFNNIRLGPEQENFFDLEIVDNVERLYSVVNELKQKSIICSYIEADVKDIVNSRIIGMALAYNDSAEYKNNSLKVKETLEKTKVFYIPIAHSFIKKQLPLREVIPAIKELFQNPEIKKITHNVKTQYGILRDNGIYTNGFVFDTLLASYVKNSTRNHELSVQAIEHLEHAMYEYTHNEGMKRNQIKFEDADPENVKKYAGDVADTIFRLTKYWMDVLSKSECQILNEIDLPVSLVLADMEFNGTVIDTNLLSEYGDELNKIIFKIERKIYTLADEVFNLNSPKQISKILYDKLKISSKRKRSTGAEVLEELAKDHEICRLILKYRTYYKLKTVYVDSFPQLIDPIDNRIHTTYNMTATATGRLSSSNPNLQNIPVRTEEGSMIRKSFVPGDKENYLILSADYSQIELRLLAHISGDENLISAFNHGVDVHTNTASKVFDVPVDEVTKDMRYKAKAVNFGIIYGQTKYGLAKALGISNQNAENFINKYFKTYPKVKRYMKNTVDKAEKNGYTETLFGRKRYFSKELDSTVAAVREFARRAAINFPIQGTGADLIKMAMIECDKKLKENGLKSKMIIQVHDEIVVEVYKEELETVKNIVKEAMELGQPFKVPLVVDIYAGETWKE